MSRELARKKAAELLAAEETQEAKSLAPVAVEDGIYFGLDEDSYHSATALGSTSLRALAKDAREWWWESEFNPDKPDEKETTRRAPLDLGKALHAHILEGEEAVAERFEVFNYELRSDSAKKAFAAIKDSGKIPLKTEEYELVMKSRKYILANPIVKEIYSQGLAETSIFWTHKSGVQLKARLDWIAPHLIADLKTFAPREDMRIAENIKKQFSNERLIVAQAAHYLEGFKQAKKLLGDGQVFGDITDEKAAIFTAAVAKAEKIDFAFVFFKTKGAPLTEARRISRRNPLLWRGDCIIAKGIDNYNKYKNFYGLKAAWLIDPDRIDCGYDEVYEEELPPYSVLFE